MGIETEEEYNPRLQHPLYTKIIPPKHNDYTLWEEYEIRVPDEKHGDDGPYNYVFDALLVGVEETVWGEISPLLIAYTTNTRDAQEAEETIHPTDGTFDDDDELVVLFFLREDETKKFITSDNEYLIAQDGEVR